jgi:hypothetical protein
MKEYRGVDVQIHNFLTSSPVGGEWSTSRPGHFSPIGKSPRYPLDRRLGGPRANLDDVEKRKFLTLPGLEPLGRPTRSRSLYRLRYPDKEYQGLFLPK